ncbi:MAG: acyltransferase [Candidatus Eisenbacteria bacterium]|uniref:Acyltransferase n=1 Tax=Eiseniibacteriota bacterium TaxID=2212470 RepID=A0A948W4J8_UNCEI|nr:acyltransferase [Candidatus Eisenbacteria bacterium]MBU1949199.1 acyltransferase [Candidatus Eisenbacteria bacterium]MBU2689424.1 acyltransferase [Candidatus Eisenbacteria bacterium]
MKNGIKHCCRRTGLYRFLSWLHREYLEDQKCCYRPGQFCFYGESVRIGHKVRINRPDRVILKNRSSIHTGTVINSTGGLYLGENSGIGYNCTIFTAQHRYRNAETIPFDKMAELKPVIIRDFVWIGAGVMILPGVEIGEGAIIGMGSVITKNVPPLAIVIGNPAEVVMYRNKEHYEKCKTDGKFQPITVDHYETHLTEAYKIRYPDIVKELGLG